MSARTWGFNPPDTLTCHTPRCECHGQINFPLRRVVREPEVGGPVDGLPVLPGEGLHCTDRAAELVKRLEDASSGEGLGRPPVRQFGPERFALPAQTGWRSTTSELSSVLASTASRRRSIRRPTSASSFVARSGR